MEAFPETGELVVTVGDGRPFVWKYDPPSKQYSASAWIYRMVDYGLAIWKNEEINQNLFSQ